MSVHRINGWKYSDFVGMNVDIEPQSNELPAATLPPHIKLNGSAKGFVVEISDGNSTENDLRATAPNDVVLANDLAVDGSVLDKGSRVVAKQSFRTSGPSAVTLIIANVIDVPTGTKVRLVLTSTDLVPGQHICPASMDFASPVGPGKNCFARGTLIETPHGALPIEQLEDGDEILAFDGSVKQISWIGGQRISGLELVVNPQLRPVRIMAGALTGGRPGQDLVVSQNHRLLVDDWRAPYLFGEEEILVPARSLINDKNVMVDCPLGGVDYYHLLMEDHEMVCANGLWAESMVPDAETLAKLYPAQQSEVHQRMSGAYDDIRAMVPALPHYSAQSVAA